MDHSLRKRPPVAGLLLCGGLSSRMGGGDKSLLTVGGQTLLRRVVDRARPQVSRLLLSANGDPARFAAYGVPVLADSLDGYPGPLAGILTGLEWLRDNAPDVEWMASFASDTPMMPVDLVDRLAMAVAAQRAEIGCARSDGMPHPVFGLWPVRLAADLRHALVDEGVRKVGAWIGRYRLAYADWPAGPADPFFNVNTPEDMARLGQILGCHGAGRG